MVRKNCIKKKYDDRMMGYLNEFLEIDTESDERNDTICRITKEEWEEGGMVYEFG